MHDDWYLILKTIVENQDFAFFLYSGFIIDSDGTGMWKEDREVGTKSEVQEGVVWGNIWIGKSGSSVKEWEIAWTEGDVEHRIT